MRALITGVTGFAGTHLAEHLARAVPDAEVWGLVRPVSRRETLHSVCPEIRFVEGDLDDAESLEHAVRAARPDAVFHLAAASPVASSWGSPAQVFQTNAVGQIHLLEAIRALDEPPLTVVACSADSYGRVDPGDVPLTEAAPLRPVSPYGASKAAQDILAGQYAEGHGLPIVRLRLFNHTGPRRPSNFVASSFARQLAEIERGLRPPRISVGDLGVTRDFTDVRDVAKAYELAAAHAAGGEVYNVCSGRPTRIRELLDTLLSFSAVAVDVTIDPALDRPVDIPVLVGNPHPFRAATGWESEFPLDRTLRDLLDWWRAQVS